MEKLRGLYLSKIVAAASVPNPKATVLVEIRHLIQFLKDEEPSHLEHGPLVGAELPFQGV